MFGHNEYSMFKGSSACRKHDPVVLLPLHQVFRQLWSQERERVHYGEADEKLEISLSSKKASRFTLFKKMRSQPTF
jgi:hypothetical protein